MSTSQWRPHNQSVSSMDSFEANLTQIEQTNQLLANIESRLNNFFHRNPPNAQNVSFSAQDSLQQKELGYPEPKTSSVQIREESVSNIGNTMLSPIQNMDFGQAFLSGDYGLQTRDVNRYINIVDAPRTGDSIATSTDKGSPSFLYKQKGSNIMGHSPSPGKEYGRVSQNENEQRAYNRSSAKKERPTEGKKELYWAPNLGGITESEEKIEKNQYYEEPEERVSGIDHRFYEKKIEILEQRLENSDREISNLSQAKGTLNGEIVRLKGQVSELQNKFVEDLNKSLKSQEERLRREFSEQEKYMEEESRENRRNFERIDELTKENNRLQDEQVELLRKYEKTKTENNRLQEELTDLLRRYENMKDEKDAQIQAEREKNLKSSFGSENRSSLLGKSGDTGTKLSSDQLKGLMEALSIYKQELESLKGNNRMIQTQFEEEIQSLKDELQYQKEHNVKLEDRIQAQSAVLTKFQNNLFDRKDAEAQAQRESLSAVKFDLSDDDETKRTDIKSQKTEPPRDSYLRQLHHNDRASAIAREGEDKSSRRLDFTSGQATDDRAVKTSEANYTDYSPNKTHHVPFTNNDIKSGIINQERKGRGREVLYQQLAQLQETPKMKSLPKNRSKSKSKSKSAVKVKPEEEEEENTAARQRTEGKIHHRQQKSPGTAYEEFEEELKRLKGVVTTKMSFKKAKRKESASDRGKDKAKENKEKENGKAKRERMGSFDAKAQKEKVEKKVLASSSKGNVKSPGASSKMATPKIPMSSKSKTGKQKIGS